MANLASIYTCVYDVASLPTQLYSGVVADTAIYMCVYEVARMATAGRACAEPFDTQRQVRRILRRFHRQHAYFPVYSRVVRFPVHPLEVQHRLRHRPMPTLVHLNRLRQSLPRPTLDRLTARPDGPQLGRNSAATQVLAAGCDACCF